MSSKESDDSLAELLTLTCEVDEWGAIRYRNSEGELHRVCGPAVIYPDGSEWWYQRGQMHREDGPAAIYPDGEVCWYLVGVQITKDQCCNDWERINELFRFCSRWIRSSSC